MNGETLLSVKDLSMYFEVGKKRTLKAVDGVSFDVARGETFGLVGESGCGKSTLGRTVVGLYKATKGTVTFGGKNVHGHKNGQEAMELSRRIQMIFQDPYTSLNPRMKVADIVAEGIDAHHMAKSGAERSRLALDLLRSVGLDEEHMGRYPHEFSGGQRQRIGIARALSVNPDFIVADEPISALDVSIQAQVINLMKSLQTERGLTYLFIAHDLSMVKYISDRIGVMYMGNMVELADSGVLFDNPLHPYTKALLSSIPVPDPKLERSRKRVILEGSVQSPVNPPDRCRFLARCPQADGDCGKGAPPLKEMETGHWAACFKAR